MSNCSGYIRWYIESSDVQLVVACLHYHVCAIHGSVCLFPLVWASSAALESRMPVLAQ
jgi:hypothetical protein